MSGAGAPTSEPFDASDLRVAVVAATWHTQVMDGLVAGAQRALADFNVTADVVRVPGSFYITNLVTMQLNAESRFFRLLRRTIEASPDVSLEWSEEQKRISHD